MVAIAKVHGTPFLLMGDPASVGDTGATSALKIATQLDVAVYATQTRYQFHLDGTGVTLNLSFTSPLLTEDWDLLSRPAHYITFDLEAAGTSYVP